MTNTHLFWKQLVATLLGVSMLAPAFAYAQVGAAAQVNAATQVITPAATVGATANVKLSARDTTAKDRGDKELDRRIQALTDVNARIDAMERVTPSFKQNLATNIQSQITGLTQLKAKLDADTDTATIKTDVQSIVASYRIFVLVVPMSRIAAAADREVTIITMMNQLGAKLQARISAAQSAGGNTSAVLASLTDLSKKLSDASTQAQAAVSVSATLAPDNGDKTKMAQNTSALKTARADIQASHQDLVTARKDIQVIIDGLKKLPQGTATASSTTSVQTQTQTATH